MCISLEENRKIKLPETLYREMETNIANLYEEFGIDKLPVDPFHIARKMGYNLVEIDKNHELYEMLIEKGTDALTLEIEGKKYIVYLDDRKIGRQRFSIAHEIGHIRMGHKEESALANRIANHYAHYLLVPEILIYALKCDDYLEVVNHFNVTDDCAMNCFSDYDNWLSIPSYREYEERILKQFGFSI